MPPNPTETPDFSQSHGDPEPNMHPVMRQALERTARMQAEWNAKEAARRAAQAEADEPEPPESSVSEPLGPDPQTKEAETREWEARVRAIAAAHGGLVPLTEELEPPLGWQQVRLPEPYGPPLPRDSRGRAGLDAEAELAGIIADCRVLMRDVAGQSARLACGAEDRIRFIETACRVARTSATVAKSVARLRAASAGAMEESRQRIIVERVERAPAVAQGGGG